MKYIVLDLEWNQTYMEKARAVQKQLELRLRGEVIQIGAVALNERAQIIGSYRITVKPRFYKKIHRHVMRLTGIDQAQIDHGTPLPEAMESFHRFCGDDAVFLTWGPDDLPMLYDNLRASKLEAPWMARYYDMQPMFNQQTDGEKRQRSLEYAMEYYSIEQNLPAHDALNDAYFTALVAQKLNLAEGIRQAELSAPDHLSDAVYGDADSGEQGFATQEEIFNHPPIAFPLCPACQQKLLKKEPTLHCKGRRFQTLYTCRTHGDIFTEVRVYRNFNETFRARLTASEATEERINRYHEKMALEKQAAKAHRRRRGGRRRSDKKSDMPTTEPTQTAVSE